MLQFQKAKCPELLGEALQSPFRSQEMEARAGAALALGSDLGSCSSFISHSLQGFMHLLSALRLGFSYGKGGSLTLPGVQGTVSVSTWNTLGTERRAKLCCTAMKTSELKIWD